MSGLWASLVLIGVVIGLGGVLTGLAVAAVNVIYRHQNRPVAEAVAEAPGVPEVTAGAGADATVPAQGGPAVTAERQSLSR
jgi:hypothetical protein